MTSHLDGLPRSYDEARPFQPVAISHANADAPTSCYPHHPITAACCRCAASLCAECAIPAPDGLICRRCRTTARLARDEGRRRLLLAALFLVTLVVSAAGAYTAGPAFTHYFRHDARVRELLARVDLTSCDPLTTHQLLDALLDAKDAWHAALVARSWESNCPADLDVQLRAASAYSAVGDTVEASKASADLPARVHAARRRRVEAAQELAANGDLRTSALAWRDAYSLINWTEHVGFRSDRDDEVANIALQLSFADEANGRACESLPLLEAYADATLPDSPYANRISSLRARCHSIRATGEIILESPRDPSTTRATLFARPRFPADVSVDNHPAGTMPVDPTSPYLVLAPNLSHLLISQPSRSTYTWVGGRIVRVRCCTHADLRVLPPRGTRNDEGELLAYDVEVAVAEEPIPWRGVLGRSFLREFRITAHYPLFPEEFGDRPSPTQMIGVLARNGTLYW